MWYTEGVLCVLFGSHLGSGSTGIQVHQLQTARPQEMSQTTQAVLRPRRCEYRLMLLRQLSAWHCPHVLPSAVLRRLRFKPCAGLLCTLSSVCMYMCVCGASATEYWAAFDIACHSAANPQQREANDGTDRWTDGPLHRACMQPVASLSACLLDTTVSATEAAVPIEMPFGLWTRLGPRNHVLDGLSGLTRRS